MLLTHGNIRKSKILKYHYLSEYNDDEYDNALINYMELIKSDIEKIDYLSVYEYLHDARILLKKINENIVLKVSSYDSKQEKTIYFDIVFVNGKLISWNCVNKNGHISRLNKKYKINEYGYEEFYEENGKKYISIIFFGKQNCKCNYYPFVTFNYEKIEVKHYERQINCFDKISEQLISTEKVEIQFNKLEAVFLDEMKEDPNLIYEYELKKEIINKLELHNSFDFEKYDYFLSYSIV